MVAFDSGTTLLQQISCCGCFCSNREEKKAAALGYSRVQYGGAVGMDYSTACVKVTSESYCVDKKAPITHRITSTALYSRIYVVTRVGDWVERPLNTPGAWLKTKPPPTQTEGGTCFFLCVAVLRADPP